MAKRRPLGQDKRAAAEQARRDRAMRALSPRDEWVIEKPDGWVLRRHVPESQRYEYSPGSLSEGGWWQSSVTDVAHAKLAARTLSNEYLICALRRNPETGEDHIAVVSRERVLSL